MLEGVVIHNNYEKFLLYPLFYRFVEKTCQNNGLFGKQFTLYETFPGFNDSQEETFENTVGKGENAGNQLFYIFHKVFCPVREKFQI